MKKLISLIFISIFFCNVFAVQKDLDKITITVLEGDFFCNYKSDLTKYLSEKLGLDVVINVSNYDKFFIDLERDNSEFYKGSSLMYVYSSYDTAILKSVYKNTINGEWEDFYQPVILARIDKIINSLKDLENAEFYFTNPNSASGYLYPELYLSANNINIEKPFYDDNSLSAKDVYKKVTSGKWDACCSYYGLFKDDWNFASNPELKVFELENCKIPMDPLWSNSKFKKEYPKLVNNFKKALLDFFKDSDFYKLVEAKDSDYHDIRLKFREYRIIDGLNFISIDSLLGLFTKNPKKLEFILKYDLHYLIVYLLLFFITAIILYMIFRKTIIKRYRNEHLLMSKKYLALSKQLKEEKDYNLKINNIEKKLQEVFKDFKSFANDTTMINYLATGEFLYNKYKDTQAMESSAIANCYAKAFERVVMISSYGSEIFDKQDDVSVPDEQQNIQNKINPRKILDNGIKEIRVKANLSNKDYKNLQKCKNIRNKVAHLKPVLQEEVISIRKALFGNEGYTSGILVKIAPYFNIE